MDLDEIGAYFFETNPNMSEKFMRRFTDVVAHLRKFPEIGTATELTPYYKMPLNPPFKYFAYYRFDDECVYFVSVVHQRMHPDAWKRRMVVEP